MTEMSDWNGQGLPPGAAARIARAKQDGVATSFLSVNGQAGLGSVGFRAVGEVMGCVVEQIGFQGYGGCGMYMGGMGGGQYGIGGQYGMGGGQYGMGGNYGMATRTTLSSDGGWTGFAPYVKALYDGWNGAISRMLTEASALGADGVVGVRLETGRAFGMQTQEFMVYGTAVRSIGKVHTEKPFSTTLLGQDMAKLIQAGWVPASIIVAISVAIRHDDYSTIRATQMYAGNMEVPGYTDLATRVRDDARNEFERRAKSSGGDGAIASSNMTLQIHELEVAEGHRDHVGEATITGTSVAQFARRGVPPPPLMMLSLKDRKEKK